jgi:hypothetical protein
LAEIAQFIPSVPILSFQLHRPLAAQIGGLDLAVLLEAFDKGEKFCRRELAMARPFAPLPYEQAGFDRLIDPAIDLARLFLGHDRHYELTDLVGASAPITQLREQRGRGIELVQLIGNGVVGNIASLDR